MKKLYYIIIVFFSVLISNAQTALYNTGNLQIHENGQLGLHTNLINNGIFDNNLGLVGFYGNNAIEVTGAFTPRFLDAEIANDNNVLLTTNIEISNNLNFIAGHFITSKADSQIAVNFLDNTFYTGENNISHIDGYTAVTNTNTFTFPVGDNDRLRPLTINSSAPNPLVKCAYFFEDPNAPVSLSASFDTFSTTENFLSVSTQEFWVLEGNQPTQVTLSWDTLSNVGVHGETLEDLRVVGWNASSNSWVNLGSSSMQGSIDSGSLTSNEFTPNNYEIITIGGTNSQYETLNLVQLDNFYMSPNGDGINDFLEIKELSLSSNNTLSIYNRAGLKVFEKENYTDEFTGFTNVKGLVINKEQGLPIGIYFYVLTLIDLELEYQGYLYLNR